MLISPENGFEERGASGENHFVSLDLLVIAGEGDIKEIFVFPQFPKSHTDIVFKVIPTQTKLFCHVKTLFPSSHCSLKCALVDVYVSENGNDIGRKT